MSTPQCPSCHASVRADAAWCPLCHLDLRPKPEPVPVPVPVLIDRPTPTRGRHARTEGWPCLPCGNENDLESALCASCGSAFLASLRGDAPAPLRFPVVGDLTRLGRSAMIGIAVGVGLLGALLLPGLLSLVGSVL